MATILVVDDEPANRALLQASLAGTGHRLLVADGGEAALNLFESAPPDIVLLDVMMPRIDGYEVCRRMRARTGTHLPIVMISARIDAESRRAGLTAGADQFLTKPIDPDEVRLRVENLLRLRAEDEELRKQNSAHAELHRFKDEMISMIVHDLKGPLTAVLANIDFARSSSTPKEEAADALTDADAGARRLKDILDTLLETQRLESGRLTVKRELIDVAPWLTKTVRAITLPARSQGINVTCECNPDVSLTSDGPLLTRVIENVLSNAVRYTPAGGRIAVTASTEGDRLRVSMGNSGTPIPEAMRERIFEKYGQAEVAARTCLGLGLYFCRLALTGLGGRMWLEEQRDLAVVFVFELPLR